MFDLSNNSCGVCKFSERGRNLLLDLQLSVEFHINRGYGADGGKNIISLIDKQIFKIFESES